MANAIELHGKTLQPIKDASLIVSYSRDYVTRLAREEKIVAKLVGRQWFVDVDSLRQYAEASAMEQELRKKQLSEERKRERMMREVAEEKNTLHVQQADSMHSRAVSVAALVLCLGLVAGWGTYSIVSLSSPIDVPNVAQVPGTTGTSPSAPVGGTGSALTPDFASRNVATLPSDNGVLLLPGSSSSTVEELFSDEVVVTKDVSGKTVVRRVNESGEVVSNEVPFVIVPVEDQKN